MVSFVIGMPSSRRHDNTEANSHETAAVVVVAVAIGDMGTA